MGATLTRTRGPALLAMAFLLAFLTMVLVATAPAATHRIVVAKTAKNATLGKTIVVGLNGHTLYSLSAERNGRFICTTKMCLSLWHPLVVRRGVRPAGVKGLATIKRPDGRRQVTFRGGPLYFFVQDKKAGDVKGEGFKDVGTWHAATLKAGSSTTPPPATTSTTPYPY